VLTANLRRRTGGDAQVTNVELFFDLVYVFAVTQLSRHLAEHLTAAGAGRTALLLAMVWLVWVYTTWVTNWLDPQRLPVRLMLLVVMLASLVLAAGLPDAFGDRGLWVGAAYAGMQIGRTAFAVAGLVGDPLRRNFQRMLVWCTVSGALALAGGFAHGDARVGLWIAAVGVDLAGGAAGFYTPGLGRSSTREWDISGGHIAERCQAFLLIALGESIVVTGGTLAGRHGVDGTHAGAFVAAFVGAVALWWLYFDRIAEEGAGVIARSADPGRLGRSAYHFIHPIMVGGIIVIAAADEQVLADPSGPIGAATAWLILGGTALYIAGHAAFKMIVWRVLPWRRLTAIAVLGLLGAAAPAVSNLTLGGLAVAVVVLLAASDRLLLRRREPAAELPPTVARSSDELRRSEGR
jgi:low temperature requirement protein LtrA